MNNFVKVMKIENINTLVIKQEGSGFFTLTKDSIIISIPNLSYLLKYLLFSDILSPKVLESVLGEYYDSRE